MEAYKESLSRFVYQTGMLMRPVITAAKALPDAQKRVAYADGEDERALRAAQMAIDDKIAHPILIGRPAVIAARIEKAGLRMQIGRMWGVQPRRRSTLPPVLGNLPPAHEARRRHARGGQGTPCAAPTPSSPR